MQKLDDTEIETQTMRQMGVGVPKEIYNSLKTTHTPCRESAVVDIAIQLYSYMAT